MPAAGRVEDHRVPLDQGAEGADAGQLVALLLGPGRVPAQLDEPGVDPVHVLLLDRDLLLQDGGVAQGGSISLPKPEPARKKGAIEPTPHGRQAVLDSWVRDANT